MSLQRPAERRRWTFVNADHAAFEMHLDWKIMELLDGVLSAFVADNRMKLPGVSAYEPRYRIVA